jgi:CRP/FNR family transcriptional regulator
MTDALEAVLRNCGLFRGLTEPALTKLVAIGRMVTIRKGEVVFLAGDPCPGIYVVGSGAVRVFRTSPSGKEHLLHLAEEGMSFAEVATIGHFPCPASAQALEEARCALLPREAFLRVIETDHGMCLQLLGGMARWVHHLVGLTEDLVLRDAGGRLARHLLEQDPGDKEAFALPMRKKDLASHLNLTSETLSRTLRRFSETGLIEALEGQRLRVLDRDGLEQVAQGLTPLL